MAKPLDADDLWEAIQPLLPSPKPRRYRYSGREPLNDRKALTGLLFILKTAIPWEDLPVEMACGCAMSCWRRLHAWQEQGIWFQLLRVLIEHLDDGVKIDWSHAAIDSSFVCAFEGFEGSGPNPTDRGRPGVKNHTLVDAHGIPLAAESTPGNVPEIKELLPLVETAGPLDEETGQPERQRETMYGDRAYDSEPHREELRARLKPVASRFFSEQYCIKS